MQTIKFEIYPNFFIVADTYGDLNNKPVLFLHGGGQTRHSWGDSAKIVAEHGYYSIVLDARGHGDSSWSENGEYRIEDFGKDLKAIIHQLGKSPALVGASMGGLTSLIAEGEADKSIASVIVLVDIAPKAEQKGIERIFAFMSSNKHGFTSIDEAAEAVAAYLPNRPKPQDHSRLEKNLRLRADGRYYWHWDMKMLELWKSITPDQQIKNETRMYNAAKNLKVPTMIVRGGISDVVSDKVMAEFLDEVPHVRSVNVSGAGHMVAGDSNHAFTNAVLEFLKEVY
ncbi:alpha/beta hydrolase [Arcicella sp. LKC2W]|uniref:alpha/beta fold hydrolase n=1 Tax=Arcicella sp. LKC2W TaxID=2984198 RepID=UPI002B1FB3A3|nr:alpha/beta hydrolase [Arcicella sp. LKC2W]MEA5457435.1 alpha/beta hydrolase [Arcicella sp. LKC2W]